MADDRRELGRRVGTWRRLGLLLAPPRCTALVALIAEMARLDGKQLVARPGHARLAAVARTTKRTVERQLRQLVACGWLSVRPGAPSPGRALTYQLQVPESVEQSIVDTAGGLASGMWNRLLELRDEPETPDTGVGCRSEHPTSASRTPDTGVGSRPTSVSRTPDTGVALTGGDGNRTGIRRGNGRRDPRDFEVINELVFELAKTLRTTDPGQLYLLGGRSRHLSPKQVEVAIRQLAESGRLAGLDTRMKAEAGGPKR